MAPVVWGRGALALGSSISALAMGATATAGTALGGSPAAPWAAAVIARLSVAVTALAALLPWRPRLASRLVRLVTAYLVVLLLVVTGLAA